MKGKKERRKLKEGGKRERLMWRHWNKKEGRQGEREDMRDREKEKQDYCVSPVTSLLITFLSSYKFKSEFLHYPLEPQLGEQENQSWQNSCQNL